jgi:hypothetical protein
LANTTPIIFCSINAACAKKYNILYLFDSSCTHDDLNMNKYEFTSSIMALLALLKSIIYFCLNLFNTFQQESISLNLLFRLLLSTFPCGFQQKMADKVWLRGGSKASKFIFIMAIVASFPSIIKIDIVVAVTNWINLCWV